MKWDSLDTRMRFAGRLALGALLVAAFSEPALLRAQVDCSLPGRNTPAKPVPQCVDSQGFAVSCGAPGRIRLWPNGFRPASPIPSSRDSTDRVAGNTLPSRARGHESFASVDVVTVAGISRRLHVAYTGGIQVWDIGTNPAKPVIRGSRDGWAGEFIKWPAVGEKLHFIEDVSAVSVSSTTDVIAVAGSIPVGFSLWEFNTSTAYEPLYQDEGIDARQVRLVEHGTTLYAIVGSDEGVAVYNVTTARGLSGCLDNQGTACNGVFRGYVTSDSRKYVDALSVNNRIYVSASDGTSFQAPPIELWELADPQRPASAVLRMSESRNSAGSALLRYDGHTYLAFVDEAGGFDDEELRVLLIDGCVQGSDCSLAGGTVEEAVTPISLDPAPADGPDYASTRDFLTYSTFDGKPYLYYGIATGGLRGPALDRLFDLGSLRPPDPSPLSTFPEVTAGGGSYTDPCNGATIRYWSHYYHRNYHGLNEMVPRIGQLSSSGYFYRAANTILDVHLLGAGTPTTIAIVSAGTGKRSAFESCETVPLDASLAGTGPAWWEWRWDGKALPGCSGSFGGTGDLAGVDPGCGVLAERFLDRPIFLDGFESGDTGAWSRTVSRLAAAGTGVTVEVLVWKTADTSQPPEDTEQVTFTIVESEAPKFSGTPQVTVSGLSATLTHPAVNTLTWTWEIESPAGTATCTFPGRGQVKCVKATATVDQQSPETLTHTWPSPGTYKYRVTLSNCGAATAVRNAEVTVEEELVQPDVLSFTLRGAQAACCGNVVSGFTCSRGVEVEFAVRMKEDASYAFSFDWARTSPSASPNFAFRTPSGKDAAKLEWYFKHTFSNTGDVYPIVRARIGGAAADQGLISVPLRIISGSCQ